MVDESESLHAEAARQYHCQELQFAKVMLTFSAPLSEKALSIPNMRDHVRVLGIPKITLS